MTFIGLPAFQISIDSFKTIGVGLLKNKNAVAPAGRLQSVLFEDIITNCIQHFFFDCNLTRFDKSIYQIHIYLN